MVELLKNLKNWVSSLIRIHLLYPRSLDATCQVCSIIPDVMKKATHTTVGSGIKFLVWNELRSFGNCNYIGDRTIIDNCTSIGSFCSISMDVKIGLRNHSLDTVSTSPFFYRKSKGFTSKDNLEQSRSVVIENDVLISANVVVLESVRLHTGCIIAAGAVVTSDVPPYAIVGGVPAKILKYRFSEEIIDALLSSEWWNSDLNKIKNANSLFNDPLKFIEEIKS